MGEMPSLRGRPSPFPIVTGASAGAINGVAVASRSDDFHAATKRLAALWSALRVENVFRTDLPALLDTGARLAADVLLGHLFGAGRTVSIFDASPLRSFLGAHLAPSGIARSIRDRHLYAAAVTATSYHSGKSFTFVQGRKGHPMWAKSRRVTLAVDIGIDHVCASAAIPIVFPPVSIPCQGRMLHFGDGGLRLVTPCSPAIRLGADRLLAIGIRCHGSAADLSRAERWMGDETDAAHPRVARPPLAQICGVFLNAIFLDHLDADLDHLRRMNELLAEHSSPTSGRRLRERTSPAISEPMRRVEALALSPSEDLALVAKRFSHRMPRIIRLFLDALGTPDAQSADLMSYLLFDAAYTRELIEIGYRDAAARTDEIEAHLQRSGRPRLAKGRARL
jgi:NTE family protein